MTEAERLFQEDLLHSGLSYGVTLRPDIAEELVNFCRRNLKRLEYRPARDIALLDQSLAYASENEVLAYKDFIDRRSYRWLKRARELRNRPFAPLREYEDEH